MINIDEIKEALLYGTKNGYILFPEAKDEKLIGKLKENIYVSGMLKQVMEYCSEISNEGSVDISFSMYMEFERTGNRIKFENAYFKKRKQLFSLVIAYITEKDENYLPLIEERLWQWCDLYSWELPAHFSMTAESIRDDKVGPDKSIALFAAESAFFFAEILSIIGENIDAFLVQRLKNEIFKRVIDVFKVNEYWWESAHMNWSSVCGGSIGSAALYLVQDIDELSMIIKRVINCMEAFVDAFDKDGLITEGLAYWSYGFSFYVYFAELLKERTAGKISLLTTNDKIKKIAELPQILQFPSTYFVNFSDAGNEKWSGDCGLFSKLEEILGISGYNYKDSYNIYYDHTFRWPAMMRKIFWSTNLNNEKYNEKLGTYYFSESQWLVDRRENEDKNFVAFAAKGGHNDEPHNHNDLGNFILNYKGQGIFIDIGSPEYVREYFSNNTRYNFIAAASFGHSVPIINNKCQSYGKEYNAEVIRCENEASKTYFDLVLNKAYSCEELINFERKFIWNNEKLQLNIKDEFEFNTVDNEIQEVFITSIKPKLVEPGKVIIQTDNFKAELFFQRNLQCTIEECTYNNHSGTKTEVYRISIYERIDKTGKLEVMISLT